MPPAVISAFAKTADEVAAGINSGKYKSADEAKKAIKAKMEAASPPAIPGGLGGTTLPTAP
jgi:hypothetical protein